MVEGRKLGVMLGVMLGVILDEMVDGGFVPIINIEMVGTLVGDFDNEKTVGWDENIAHDKTGMVGV